MRFPFIPVHPGELLKADFALPMEAALGVEPGLLLRMQTSYNLHVAKKDKKLIDRLNEVRKIAVLF